MFKFVCPRCEYKTKTKTVLKRHLSRKAPCVVTKEEVDRQTYISHCLYGGELLNIQNVHTSSQILKDDTKYVCEYCSKVSSRKSNLHRHLTTCKARKKKLAEEEGFKKQLEDRDDIIKQLRNEIAMLWSDNGKLHTLLMVKAVSTLGNNNSDNNSQLLNLGNEKLDHVDIENIKTLIQNKSTKDDVGYSMTHEYSTKSKCPTHPDYHKKTKSSHVVKKPHSRKLFRKTLCKKKVNMLLSKQNHCCRGPRPELNLKQSCPMPNGSLKCLVGLHRYDVDHIVELEKGGIDDFSNYQILCVNCHDAKTTIASLAKNDETFRYGEYNEVYKTLCIKW